jgi:hypothetical protein
MSRVPIEIVAEWDPDASVWVATTDDLDGFVMEDATLERLASRIPGVVADLVEGNHPELASLASIPFHLRDILSGHFVRAP